MNFGRDFGMMLSIVAGAEGKPREGGMVFKDGVYDYITECKMDSDWDEHGYQTAPARQGEDPRRQGLRGHRQGALADPAAQPPQDARTARELNTRITEGMTEYHCDGHVGYGLSEYLDQIVDGRPTGKVAEETA